jgi:hypothetical protein
VIPADMKRFVLIGTENGGKLVQILLEIGGYFSAICWLFYELLRRFRSA